MPAIRHIVHVNLNYDEGDTKFKEFFVETRKTYGSGAIPEVAEYHHYKQIIPEAQYRYGFVLEFNSEEDFQKCIEHPLSLEYNKKYWNDKFLKDCLECNFVEFE